MSIKKEIESLSAKAEAINKEIIERTKELEKYEKEM